MAWGAKVSETITLTSPTDVQYSTPVTVLPNEILHYQWDRTDTPTVDSVILTVFGTVDDAPENWDDESIGGFTVLPGGGPAVSFKVKGFYRVRVCIDGSGSADTVVGTLAYRLGS